MFKVDKAMSRSNIPRTIRFNEELFDVLAEISSSEKISFNSLVLQCCQYAIRNYDNGGDSVEIKDDN
ncbi:hypothetical protein LAD12857_32050 [Lacrimispora amygdalina]|uniref:Toxin-antitoxin system HicB family antitoxin n=1 Tax=Lacrimispora amygdalina TaxID=253257 RepID=A0A3E2N3R3_9FIRM|nr:hypothetical protein [Clostridium indicum]RFZ75561.1 hypothetical protein DS742_28320 [Clostridium indicum]